MPREKGHPQKATYTSFYLYDIQGGGDHNYGSRKQVVIRAGSKGRTMREFGGMMLLFYLSIIVVHDNICQSTLKSVNFNIHKLYLNKTDFLKSSLA